jgi:hypothetical protein
VNVWQQIETAPRDGTSILVHNYDAPGLSSGHAEKCWAGNTAVAEWWANEGAHGKWICYMDQVLDPELHFSPTHWMPLPDVPA